MARGSSLVAPPLAISMDSAPTVTFQDSRICIPTSSLREPGGHLLKRCVSLNGGDESKERADAAIEPIHRRNHLPAKGMRFTDRSVAHAGRGAATDHSGGARQRTVGVAVLEIC